MVTLMNVVVMSAFLLSVMAITYRASIRSMEAQKKIQLSIDYDARQQSFLRALVTLTPQYAANTMLAGSAGNAQATLNGLYTQAGQIARLGEILTPAERTAMGFGAVRNANTGDVAAIDAANIVDYVTGGGSAVGAAYTANYPHVMAVQAGGVTNTAVAPELSSSASYTGTAYNGTPVQNTGNTWNFAMLQYPNIRFGYKNPGDNFIARHNWWNLYVHPRSADLAAVGLGTAGMAMNQGRYEYILSVYEIPSQLAISAASFIDIGTNVAVTDQAGGGNVVVQGNVFAKGANVAQGNLSSIATTQGSTFAAGDAFTAGGTVGANAATGAQNSTATRTTFETTNNSFFPISQASDYARSLFVPINPGFDFFDRFAVAVPQAGAYSNDSWYSYTRGCNQCVMQLDVVEVDGSGNPITLEYTAFGYNTFICKPLSTYRVGAFVDWPDDAATAAFDLFPFESTTTSGGNPALAVYLGRLEAWLQTADGGNVASANIPDYHSIVINGNYTIPGGNVVQPTQANSPVTIQLLDGVDLTAFTSGFSIVSSYAIEMLDNFNDTPFAGATSYPATSIFAPRVRYGTAAVGVATVNVVGGISSLNTTADANNRVDIFDFEDLAGGNVANVQATLSTINTLAALPPVNMMNWLVVIQKQGQ